MDWFLYDKDIRNERVNVNFEHIQLDIQDSKLISLRLTPCMCFYDELPVPNDNTNRNTQE